MPTKIQHIIEITYSIRTPSQCYTDLRLSDPIRYEELSHKGIDWMTKEIQKDEALHALCHVAALNFKKMIEEERQRALVGIMMLEN